MRSRSFLVVANRIRALLETEPTGQRRFAGGEWEFEQERAKRLERTGMQRERVSFCTVIHLRRRKIKGFAYDWGSSKVIEVDVYSADNSVP